MKLIITEHQYNLLKEEEDILKIPSMDMFGSWDSLQRFLSKKGNPKFFIDGDLDIKGEKNIDLGNLIGISGSLYGKGRDTLISLGELKYVGGDLELEGSSLENLGKLEKVEGTLNLFLSSVSDLGNLEYVGDNFLFSHTLIKSLKNLHYVGRTCSGINSNLKDLGNLKFVGESLYLMNTPISTKYTENEIRKIIDAKVIIL